MTERRWDTEWRNLKQRRERGKDAIHPQLASKRKRQLVAQRRGCSQREARYLIENGEVEITDDEIEGWSPHEQRVRGGRHV